MLRKIFIILSLVCFLFFILLEKPTILAKLIHTNTQQIFWGKTFVLIGAELLLYIILICASLSIKSIKIFIWGLAVCSTVLFDVYFQISHKVIEYQEFLLLFQSRANLLDGLIMYHKEIFHTIPKICMLSLGFILMPPPLIVKYRKYHLVVKKISTYASVSLLSLLILLISIICIFRQGAATNKLPSAFSLYGLFLAYAYDKISNHYHYSHHLKTNPAYQESRVKHIILIIDESIRADYSPFRYLTSRNWNIYNYGNAFSYANASAPSNILLRKGARFEQLVKDFYQNPLIWDYAKQAGYTTYLIDNQLGGIGHDYFDETEREMIDHILKPQESDREIPKIISYIKNKHKTFTIIIKKGAHFPYDAYPKNFLPKLMPDKYLNTTMRQKYFKTLEYQSIGFWERFFKIYTPYSTLVIYTSDHGQNLQDQEGLTHGSTEHPYWGEGIVPLVVLSNFDDLGFKNSITLNYNHASHFNIIPTILEAMGFSLKELGYKGINQTLKKKIQSPGGFFYGIPFGYFGKEPNFTTIKNYQE